MDAIGRRGVSRAGLSWSASSLLVTAALFRLSQNAAQTTFPLLGRQDLHLGAGTIGTLGTVIGLTSVAATLVVGRWLPTHRATRAVATGCALLAASVWVFAGAGTLAPFVTAALLLGLAGGAAAPSLATEVGRADPAHRERALARYALVLSTSLAVGPLVETGILAAGRQNLRIPFVVVGGLAVAGLALTARPRGSGPPEAAPVPLPRSRPRRSGLLSTPGGRVALTVQLLYGVPFSAITVFGALLARHDFGLSPAGTQLAFSAFFVASLLGRLAITRRSPVPSKHRILVAAAAMTGLGMAVLSLRGSALVLFTAMVILGVAHGVTFPLALALVAESVPPEQLAAANASLFAATSLVSVTAPIVLGQIVVHAGYPVMCLAVLGPVAAFTAVLISQTPAPALGRSVS